MFIHGLRSLDKKVNERNQVINSVLAHHKSENLNSHYK